MDRKSKQTIDRGREHAGRQVRKKNTEWRVERYCTVVIIIIEGGLVKEPKLEDENAKVRNKENIDSQRKNKIRTR